jgi:monoamine oxidase
MAIARRHEIDARSLGAFFDQQSPDKLTLTALAVELGSDNGVPPHRQSLLAMLALIKGGGLKRYWTETEVFRCEQGNDALAKRLASAVGAEHIHLDSAVEQSS